MKESSSLEKLLTEILKIKKDFRLRLLYLYPDEISDNLISLIASEERIYNYVDIPLQHINDNILRQMRRNVSKKQILDILSKLRQNDIVVRTTLMVGFPSETEEQFGELVDFVKTQKLEHVGVFKFSREKGTPSYDMEEQVSEKIKKKREQILYEAQLNTVEQRNKKSVGAEFDVFIEGYHPDSNLLLIGRAWFQTPDVDPVIIINDYEKFEGFAKSYRVLITGYTGVDLIGKIIEKIA